MTKGLDHGMEIIPDSDEQVYHLRDITTGLWRSRAPLDSHFAWVRMRRAAARFPSRRKARAVANAYAKGIDLAKELALDGASPESIIYPPPRVGWEIKADAPDEND